MLRPICLFAAMALLTTAAFAFTPDERQKNAIETIAQAVAGSETCDDWALNEKLVAAISLANGFRVNDAATFAYIEERVLFHADRIKDRTREDICAAMGRLYGPEGSNAPDLALKVK
ncbi:MAG: hypothetical protein QM698_07065 [Micropepsaceae bacterium]